VYFPVSTEVAGFPERQHGIPQRATTVKTMETSGTMDCAIAKGGSEFCCAAFEIAAESVPA